MKRTVFLAALLATTSLASGALAADLPRKAPPPAPIPYADWSGIYVGLEGGYGWGDPNNALVIPGHAVTVVDHEGAKPDGALGPAQPVGPNINTQFATFFGPDVAVPSPHQHGWLFGGFAGVQKQWGNWVLGLEADFDGANIKGSGTSSATSVFDVVFASFPGFTGAGNPVNCPSCLSLTHSVSIDSKIDMLGSLRGKVGFVPAPDWLIYGTGGLAFAHRKDAIFDTQSAQLTPPSVAPGQSVFLTSGGAVIPNGTFSSFGAIAGTSMFGWAAGAGVDWKFWHDAGSAWVLGIEYLHYGFGTQTVTFQTTSPSTLGKILGTGGNTVAMTTSQSVDTIKGRISYMFSIH